MTHATATQECLSPPTRTPPSQRPTHFDANDAARSTTLDLPPAEVAVPAARAVPVAHPATPPKVRPLAVPVPGITRDIEVKIASERQEWEEALEIVTQSYRSRGYEPADTKGLRFTPFHALPETTTFVAKHAGHVVATLSLVADNTLLGLPMECIFAPEIRDLRLQGRRLGEASSLADAGLGVREFLQVFITIIKLTMQYHVGQGGDTWVITVNPRHRNFYSKVLGFAPLGPCRSYPCVQDAPAEAYLLDLPLMKANAPKMYDTMFGEPLGPQVLAAPRMSPSLVREFGGSSTQTSRQQVQDLLSYVEHYGSPRRW